jgi:hypothetical protein
VSAPITPLSFNRLKYAGGSEKSTKAALEAAKINLAYTQIVAPYSARFSRTEMTVGNVLSAGTGAPVLIKNVSISPIYASDQMDEQTYLMMVDDAAVGTDQDKMYVMVADSDNQAQYSEPTLGGMHKGLRIIEKIYRPPIKSSLKACNGLVQIT